VLPMQKVLPLHNLMNMDRFEPTCAIANTMLSSVEYDLG
jgi:hypothetical protein